MYVRWSLYLPVDVGIADGSSAVGVVAAWYPPSDLTTLPGDLGTDPAAEDTREAQLFCCCTGIPTG